MNDFRCSQCKKLLAKIQPMISKDGTNYLTFHENGKVKDIIPKIEIICPRCKTMNVSDIPCEHKHTKINQLGSELEIRCSYCNEYLGYPPEVKPN